MQPRGGAYTADDIEVLSGLEPVRRRPGMYVGDPHDGVGLHHIVFSTIAYAIDEARAAIRPCVDVVLRADGAVCVADNGRGLPVTPLPDGRSPIELMLTTLFGAGSSRTFDRGVGLAVVNALSSRLEIVVRRDGGLHRQTFAAGHPLGPLESAPLDGGAPGTTIIFWPDPTIFRHDARPAAGLRAGQIAADLAWMTSLVPGFVSSVTDERVSPPRRSAFGGRDVDRAAVWRAGERPLDLPSARGQPLRVEVAVRAALPDEDPAIDCYTNGFRDDDGTHLRGARRALARAARRDRAAVERARIVVVVSHPLATVDRSSRTLRSPEVGPVAVEVVGAALDAWLDGNPAIDARAEDAFASALDARLHTRPDDEEAALMLADQLLAAGDPRGELIALEHRINRSDDPAAVAAAVAAAAQILDEERVRIWNRPGGFPFRARWEGRPYVHFRSQLERTGDEASPAAIVRILSELTDAGAPRLIRTATRELDDTMRAAGFLAAGSRFWRTPDDHPSTIGRLVGALPTDAALTVMWDFMWTEAALGPLVGLQSGVFGQAALVSSLELDLPSGRVILDAKIPLRHTADRDTLREWRRAVAARLGPIPRTGFSLVSDGKTTRLRL